MKPVLLFPLTIITVLIFCLFTSPAHSEGGLVGSGDSIVQLPSGATVPADLFYRRVNPGTPDSYRPIDLKSIPGLLDEITQLNEITRFRAGYESVSPELFEHFYTDRLSSEDPLPVIPGLESRAASFTYSFSEPEKETGYFKTRRVIELKPEYFEKLSVRNQALLLFHEYIHHRTSLGHDLIAPLVAGLGTVMELRDRQLAGDRSDLTDKEYEILLNLHGALMALRSEPRNGITIARRGGGIVYERYSSGKATNLAKLFGTRNFVGVTSWVEISFFPTIPVDNTFIDSSILFDSEGGCEHNMFINLRFIELDSKTRYLSNVHCSGGKNNHVKDLQLNGAYLKLLGNGNQLENIRIMGRRYPAILIEGNFNRVENSTMETLTLRTDRSTLTHCSLGEATIEGFSGARFDTVFGNFTLSGSGAQVLRNSDLNGKIRFADRSPSVTITGLKMKSHFDHTFWIIPQESEINFDPSRYYYLDKLYPSDSMRRRFSEKSYCLKTRAQFEKRFGDYTQPVTYDE